MNPSSLLSILSRHQLLLVRIALVCTKSLWYFLICSVSLLMNSSPDLSEHLYDHHFELLIR